MERREQPFILVGPAGIYYLGLHDTEETAWAYALGWPGKEEITARKQAGFEMLPATVTYKRTNNGA